MVDFPEPTADFGDRKAVLLTYVDYFRSTVASKVSGLADADLRRPHVPSGWTPLELVKHLTYMERRWLVWGFLAEPVPDPWGDQSGAGRWYVDPAEASAALLEALAAAGRRTREIVGRADLGDVARRGGRFALGDPAPTLERILLHVLQEYARHAGHLDVVREMVDGSVGE